MKTKEILEEIKRLINTPDKWIQNNWCNLGAIKTQKIIESEKDCKFCLWGSLEYLACYKKVITKEERARASKVLETVLKTKFNYEKDMVSFNDTHTHSEIISLLDKAIAAA